MLKTVLKLVAWLVGLTAIPYLALMEPGKPWALLAIASLCLFFLSDAV